MGLLLSCLARAQVKSDSLSNGPARSDSESDPAKRTVALLEEWREVAARAVDLDTPMSASARMASYDRQALQSSSCCGCSRTHGWPGCVGLRAPLRRQFSNISALEYGR